jgi:hypothetical protein
MKLQCKKEKCVKENGGIPYEWEYKGKSSFYATCPKCLNKVKIQEVKDGS